MTRLVRRLPLGRRSMRATLHAVSPDKLAMMILAALAAPAAAAPKKPTAAQAVEVATTWAKALEGEEAQPLTADTFTAFVSDDMLIDIKPCSKAPAKTKAAVAKSLECVKAQARFSGALKPVKAWKKNVP